jgi:hypothetical protein
MSENQINENPSITELSPRAETPEGEILPSGGLNFVFDAPRFGSGGLRSLKATLQANPNIGVVIFDTLIAARGADRAGSTQYEKDYGEMDNLKAIADEYDLAMVVVHHLRKSETKDSFDMVTGSNGSTGACDNIILLTKDNRDGDAVLKIYSRDMEDHDVSLRFDHDTRWWRKLGEPAVAYQISKEQQEIYDFLRKEGQAIRLGDVASFLGKKKPIVYKLMSKLVNQELVLKVGFGLYKYWDKTAPAKEFEKDCSNCSHFDAENDRCDFRNIDIERFIPANCCKDFTDDENDFWADEEKAQGDECGLQISEENYRNPVSSEMNGNDDSPQI